MKESAMQISEGEALARADEQLKLVNLQLAEEIDDHRRTEARLRESEEKLQNIISAEPTWVNICDTNGKILFSTDPAQTGLVKPADYPGSVVARTGEVISDISERKSLEHQQQYVAFQSGVAEMSASILHNIGNTVGGINGYIEKIGKDVRKAIKII